MEYFVIWFILGVLASSLVSLLIYSFTYSKKVCRGTSEIKRANKSQILYNLGATVIHDVVIYDIPAFAINHEVDEIKAGTKVVVKEIKPMIDGRWYLIEIGSKVGYCPKENLLL